MISLIEPVKKEVNHSTLLVLIVLMCMVSKYFTFPINFLNPLSYAIKDEIEL